MLVDNKKVWIYWRKLESSYSYANRKVLVEPPRKIGGSISSTSKMLANVEEQKEIMPDIISVSPTSPNWSELLSSYWNSISIEIPESGKELEVGFIYDIQNSSKSKYIKQINDSINSEKSKLTTDNDLKSYIDNKLNKVLLDFNKSLKLLNSITNDKAREAAKTKAYKDKYDSIVRIESERYKVGTPISPDNYMLYRYCLIYRDVANEFNLATKSPYIRFYLHSEEDIKRFKEQAYKLERSRMSAYLDTIKSVSKVENVLYAMGFGEEIPKEDIDKYTYLDKKSKENSNKFISIATNKNLEILGLIEKYIQSNILHRLSGSQVIVDGVDSSKIIGNNVNEVVSWFSNKSNAAEVSEYAAKFKSLPK